MSSPSLERSTRERSEEAMMRSCSSGGSRGGKEETVLRAIARARARNRTRSLERSPTPPVYCTNSRPYRYCARLQRALAHMARGHLGDVAVLP